MKFGTYRDNLLWRRSEVMGASKNLRLARPW